MSFCEFPCTRIKIMKRKILNFLETNHTIIVISQIILNNLFYSFIKSVVILLNKNGLLKNYMHCLRYLQY